MLDILEEESIEPNSNRNSVILQNKGIESLNNSKKFQNMNVINTLDTSNSSIDSLKVSDTTLESSSCDDGKNINLTNASN